MRKTENSYVIRYGVRYAYGISFLLLFLMVRKARDYEKSVPGAQITPKAWGILQLVVSLNVAIYLAVPLEVLGNMIKYFDRR